MRKIYSALDIGSSFIKLVVGEFINGKLNILCAIKKESKGFKCNQITNEESLIKSINSVLNEASEMLNFKITKMIVNMPTDYNEFILSDSTIPVTSEDGIVQSSDILKVLQNASIDRIKANDELIANVPIMFQVGDEETAAPFGKRGKTISVKSILVATDKKKVYDLIKLLEKCEIEVLDITTTGLVDYYNFKNQDMNNKNAVVVNMGGTTTNISIFSKGIYINNVTLDIGGESIDKEIAINYNLSKKEAINLKNNLAVADIKDASKTETMLVTNNDGKEVTINQYDLSILVIKKLEEILKNIKKNINYLTKKEISYIIITGGLSELKDIASVLNKIFNNVQIGYINELGARDASFSVSIGMIKYFKEKLDLREKDFGMPSDENIESMMNNNSKIKVAEDTILGKVFSYFFDN